MKTLADTGEHGFIRAIRERFPMALAGDDGAVLQSLQTPVVTTDSFFQGTHFHTWWTEPDKLAGRLLEATLSDLAAMGAESRYLFSSVVLPHDINLEWLMEFYSGLTGRNDCALAGGETVKGHTFGITLTAIGECGTRTPFRRSTAKSGDSLWVTGPLGRSFNSPELLEKGRTARLTETEKDQTELFLSPRARFDAVQAIREAGSTTAIDISDGLFSECRHLVRESGVSISLNLDKVPLVYYCRELPREACSAGEDFELLFTVPPGVEVPGFHQIGHILPGKSLTVVSNGEKIDICESGYDHFN